MPDTAIIIPARLASTRFPRKLLHPVAGKPILLWTAERVQSIAPELPLFFAIDDPLLEKPLQDAGFATVMTRVDHACGTDRIAEANQTVQADHVINVQADEPLVTREQILALKALIHSPCEMATLCAPLQSEDAFRNPNVVKVVCSFNQTALYFSRSPIPYNRDEQGALPVEKSGTAQCFAHLGLYAYKREFLEAFGSMRPGVLEQLEKLEQLRALENGCSIAIDVTTPSPVGIDTVEDALKFENLITPKA